MNRIFLKSGEYTIEQLDNIVEKFPNGITSYLETYYLIAGAIASISDKPSGKIAEIQEEDGFFGIQNFAENLTDKFEILYKGEEWYELDYFETVYEFLEKELYGNKDK